VASTSNASRHFASALDTHFNVAEAISGDATALGADASLGAGTQFPQADRARLYRISSDPPAPQRPAPDLVVEQQAIPLTAADVRVEEALPWTVEAVTNYETFLALEPVWNRLVDEAHAGHPFVRHEWIRAWWESFGAGRELHILLVRANREPIAIVPLMSCAGRFCGLPVRQLQFIWNVYAERFDFIVGRWPQLAYRAALAYLSQRTDWDLLLLPQLPTGSASLAELPRLASQSGMSNALQRSCDSPYLPVFGSWQNYWESLDRKHRSNLRNREKRLSQLGALSLEIVSSPEHVANALEDGFCLEGAAWKDRTGTSIAACPETRRFYTLLAERAAERGWLRLCFLKLNEQRIAFAYYLEYANKLFLLKPGYDPKFAAFSPSSLLCNLVLRDAYRRGILEVDFLANSDDWKRRWTKHLRPHYRLYVFPGRLEGRMLHWIKFRLIPSLAEERVLRLMRDALDLLRGRWRMLGAAMVGRKRPDPAAPRVSRQLAWTSDAPIQTGEA
jgi:CelD/BcsL family acetyltransferase involved in cellulose biosynthesis